MTSIRISTLKLISSMKSVARFDIRPFVAYTSKYYYTGRSANLNRFDQNGIGMLGTFSKGIHGNASFSNRLLRNSGFSGINSLSNYRLFSSGGEPRGSIPDVGASATNGGSGGVGGDDLVEKLKEVWQSTTEVVKTTGEKAKEVSDEAIPHVQQWLDAHPYLGDVLVPVGSTLLAWSLLPRLFRQFHKYAVEGPGSLIGRGSLWGPVPYEKSFWGALEDPVRYFITFIAFLKIGEMVAPTVIASQYVGSAWSGALVVSVVWFLNRWKTNVITRALVVKKIVGVERDKLLTLDKISSVGLLVVGSMALAEACGVAVQSILTVGGIGGVATAFAAKDILGNVLSGLSVQISQPFSIGDTIKVGSVEGQVVEMGLTTTSLLTAEKFPIIVPNSLFSSQGIVNKSRAEFRSIVRKIPLRIDDIDKISQISEDIESMLRSNPNVFLEKEAPYCFLSHIERLYAELTFGCNLKQMTKKAEQGILLEAVRIIKQHGVMLGSTHEDTIN